MPYEIGAKVKLTRDVQVTADDTAARSGLPGPLSLAAGLAGIVSGSAQEAGGAATNWVAAFDREVRPGQLQGFAAGLVQNLRQQVVAQGGHDGGVGARIRYRVRFENGFVLDGIEEDWLAGA
ncbi:hypothetical protein BX285_6860 [Streptomyces sp. 1114.5]|uniref:hypothetical protein n=1 Tax=unclassified Streptomyces TaxID=2593676 RepID=UPI000BD91149|nr:MULTISPECIES: hypothetical protein [unclassified Streptomyces]RKT09756.1 hypothetical protein BX285_6860 [Streptomyces sp. 1114.5]SOB88894.1 hypothetical protein SAMN06272789_7216 [Streptomyces sp. 1331.2]